MKRAGKLAVYAGSFDPLTVGHLWMIEEGARLFDQLIVAIGINPEKRYRFSLGDRLDMLQASTQKLRNIKITSFENQFLIGYAKSVRATHILRGIRSESDYEYERVMRNVNGDLDSHVTTVFLMPPRGIAEVSSSMVKGLIGPTGWQKIVRDYVPAPVYSRLVKTQEVDPYLSRWIELWKSLGAHGDPLPVYRALVARYSEPQRAYHNLTHIQHCLEEFEPVRRRAKYGGAISMAIWFHDAIYDPKAKDNEEQSAALAGDVMKKARLPDGLVQHVKRLILATKHNAPPVPGGPSLIVDVDLSILGQSRKKFSAYESQIRREYAWVEDDAFAKGRSAILKSFLERPTIYNTPYFKGKYEAAARRNLAFSIAQLGRQRTNM